MFIFLEGAAVFLPETSSQRFVATVQLPENITATKFQRLLNESRRLHNFQFTT